VGAGYRVTSNTQLELVQRWIGLPGDSTSASVTSVRVRTVDPFGGQFWGGLDHAAGLDATTGTAGWSPTARLNGGWALHGMVERRFGLGSVPLNHPSRALPFVQAERDRWSAGAGVQWSPVDSVGRFTARLEGHQGDLSQGYRAEMTGEAPLGASAAFLARVESWAERRDFAGQPAESVRERALVGLAVRPVESNVVNLLGRLEWRRTLDPGAGTPFVRFGEDRRLIGAADLIATPSHGFEMGARYAARWSLSDPLGSGVAAGALAHYLGGRMEAPVVRMLSSRLDSRLLIVGDDERRFSVAPALVIAPGGGLEVEAGYRFGDLRDADFGARGGAGLYATLALRFSEGAIRGVADFWRDRVAAER
jgi:hypothetical protein